MTNPQPDTHEVPNVETVAAMLEAEKLQRSPALSIITASRICSPIWRMA